MIKRQNRPRPASKASGTPLQRWQQHQQVTEDRLHVKRRLPQVAQPPPMP